MKKKIKALLIMLVLIMPFVTANVYAEELPETKLQEPQQEEQENTWTLEKFMELFKTVTLDIKESEALNISEGYNDSRKTSYLINEQINKILSDNKITFPLTINEEEGDITINSISANIQENIHEAYVSLAFSCNSLDSNYCSDLSSSRKTINVTYSNTKDYDEEVGKEIQNKLSKIDLNNIIATEINSSNLPTNSGESEEYIKKIVENGFNDDNINVVVYGGLASDKYNVGFGRQSVLIFKNDILYAQTWFTSFYMPQLTIPAEINEDDYINYATPIIKEYVAKTASEFYSGEITSFEKVDDFGKFMQMDIGYNNIENVYKIKFANANDEYVIHLKQDGVKNVVKSVYFEEIDGVDLSGTTIDESSTVYTELKDVMKEKGYENIFGAFELKVVTGDITSGLTLAFNVGNEHNGKQAYILHQKHDGSYEEFSGVVENGVIKIVVNELSPFMIALGDKVEETTNNAGTGTTNIALYGTIAVIALGGMAYTIKKKNN